MSLELILNLAWLAVVAGVFISAIRLRLKGRDSAYGWITFLAATLCVVVLIFPAISITDDYHSDVLLLDDNTKRVISSLDVTHSPAALAALFGIVLLLIFVSTFRPLDSRELACHPSSGFVTSSTGRAPPSL